MPGQADARNIEQIIHESEPDGGYYQKIAEFGWWNAVDITLDIPVAGGSADHISGTSPEVAFAAAAAGGPYGVQWGNSEDGTIAWNFTLPRNYMAQTGITANQHRKQTWVLDVVAAATNTATALRARLRRGDVSATMALGSSVTATSGDQTVAVSGACLYTFTWTNPAGNPKDLYQLNMLPAAALGLGDTLNVYSAVLYAKMHGGFASRSTRNP